MENTNYETELLTPDMYKIFAGIYNNFRSVAAEDYMFELPPVEYEEFIDSIDKNYIKCEYMRYKLSERFRNLPIEGFFDYIYFV